LFGGRSLWDSRTVSVHFNEPHWIAGRVSKKTKTKHNHTGNLESWYIDCAAGLLYERKRSGNVWHAQVDTLLCWIVADSTLEWSGNREVKPS
jgi:hypothetical protein